VYSVQDRCSSFQRCHPYQWG